ncbi:MAG: PAS domain S-box protein, partial [Terriglobia bacterium]
HARRKDGSEFPVEISLSPLQTEGGVLVTSIIHDISERRRSEQELGIRARQQAAVAQLGQRALAGTDLSALMEEAVTLVAETLEVEYCKVLELLPDDQVLLLRAGVGWKEGLVGRATVGAGGDSQAGYTLVASEPVVVADLSRETRFHGPPLLRDHGVVSGLSCVIRGRERPYGVLGAHSPRRRIFTPDDVTFLQTMATVLASAIESKRVEEELNRLFTLSLDLLCVAGFDGYFKRLNPAWEKKLGFTTEELLAKPYLEFVHPDDRPTTRAEAQRLAAGAVTLSFENRYRCRDGSYRWLSWAAYPLPQQRLIYGAARDVTERKQAEEALRQSSASLEATNRELEAFTYSVSHDLRAPLRHIDGFSRILIEDVGPRLDPSARHYLERVRQGARRMGQLVDDLLSLSRLGRREPLRQVTGLNTLVEELIEEFRPETNGRQVEWRVGRLPFVDCDPVLIRQVFSNLLSNALKFTQPRERAVIEVGQLEQDGQSVLFVRDNGVGFSMKYVDKLFGVFQRLHRQEDFEGTGVGLATVQRIVHKHGGRIWADAELDQGATFYFTLGEAENQEAEKSIPAAATRGEP